MTNFNKPFKSALIILAFFSVWAFVMHSSVFFGLMGAVCIGALSIKNDK